MNEQPPILNDLVSHAYHTGMTPEDGAHVFTGFYRNMFGLSNWAVNVKTEADYKTFGHLYYNYQPQVATVTYEQNQSLESMEENAAHEMLHLAMARIENVFQRAAEMGPAKAQTALANLFRDECEAFVAIVANAIVNLRRGEYADDKPNCPYCNSSRVGYVHREA